MDDGIAQVESLLRTGKVCHGGFRLADLRRRGSQFYVVFRWRDNPHRFGMRLPLDDFPRSFWTGEPTTSAQEWAVDVRGYLEEELLTGYLPRAGRRPVADYIELSGDWWDPDPQHVVGPLPAGGEGQWLARDGLHPDRARRLEHRRIAWLQAYVNNAAADPFVGQAVINWAAPAMARLTLVELTPGTPSTVGRDLTWVAMHAAADAGASHVITSVDEEWLPPLGFRPAGDGMLATSTTFLAAQGW